MHKAVIGKIQSRLFLYRKEDELLERNAFSYAGIDPPTWSPEEFKILTNRIEQAKECSVCPIADTMEILEILETIQELLSIGPPIQRRYFLDAVNELTAFGISHLEKIREDAKQKLVNETDNIIWSTPNDPAQLF